MPVSRRKIAVVGIPGGWSSERLATAVADLTGECPLVDLARVSVDLSTGRAWCGQTDLTGLDALIVKKVGRTYSPKLLDRLDLLRYVAGRGVRVFSRPENMARVINRLSCTMSLETAGIPLPPTLVTEDPEQAALGVERFGRSILKPLYSSKARGMVVVGPGPGLRDDIENYRANLQGTNLIYVQKMLDLPGRDLGLVFLGGRYLATYARVSRPGAWNTTTTEGGRYEAHHPEPAVIELADRAQRIFGLDFTCVDVALTASGPVVFEVSAFGGFRGLVQACDLDAAPMYARYVLSELEGRPV